MKKAALYVRVSTHHQIDKDSLPLQKKDLINYSKLILNIDNYEIFEDAGYSAKNTKRPAYQEMISRIKNNEFSHLLVWKIDRISRNLIDFCTMYEDLKKYNCTFISKNEQFDTSSAIGEAMLKLVLTFAELERNLTGERVTSVMIDRASKGLWNGSPIPLGYRWNNKIKYPEIDPEESKTIELIFNKYLELKSSIALKDYLNTNLIKTKRGGTWTSKTVSDIIRNPFYIGTYRYNYRESSRGKKKDKNNWIILEDNHAAIISKDLWKRCNDIMDNNALRNNAIFRKNYKIHVFAGLIKCSECNNNYYAKQDKPNKDGFIPSFYACTGNYNKLGCNQKTISEKIIGTFVLNFVSNIISVSKSKKKFNNEELEQILLKGNCFKDVIGIKETGDIIKALKYSNNNMFNIKNNNESPEDNNIKDMQQQKEKFKRALTRLEDLYLFDESGISEKDYILKKKSIEDKLNSIELKLNELDNKNNNYEYMNFFISVSILKFYRIIKEEIKNYKELVKEVGRELLKEFVNTIIETIYVKDRKIVSIIFKNGLTTTFIYK